MKFNILVAGIIIVSYFLISNNMGDLAIYALDEAKNAECAREMMETGNLLVPTFNYELRTDKPPLHYYFMILAYKLFGVNEFAARFFSALMGVLTIVVTFIYARRFLGINPAFWIALVLIASLHFSLQFHMAVPDPYLVFFMTFGLFSFFKYHQEKTKLDLYLFYVALGLGVLSKGPVAIVLPGGIILLFLIFSRNFSWQVIRTFRPFLGIFIVLLVALPWYVAVGIATDGAWVRDFIFKHNLNRYTAEMEGHGGVFLLTLAYVLAGLLPFSIYIIQSFIYAFKKRANDFILFAICAAGLIIVFFAISSTKLPNYTVPAYPFLAILIGYYMYKLTNYSIKRTRLKLTFTIYFFITLAFPLGIYFLIKNDKTLDHLTGLSYYFIILPVAAAVGLILIHQSRVRSANYLVAGSFILINFLFFQVMFPKVDRQNPVTQSLPLLKTDQPIIAYRVFNPAYLFYLREKIHVFKTPEEIMNFMEQEEQIFVISRKRHLEDLQQIKDLELIFSHQDLFEPPTTIIMTNRQ
ncbi:MAG: ArnT family glycosyltransferase [Candidatus Cyclobacteriaceae bacterium M3_2C_046]